MLYEHDTSKPGKPAGATGYSKLNIYEQPWPTTREEAKRLLDKRKEGQWIAPWLVTAALMLTEQGVDTTNVSQ